MKNKKELLSGFHQINVKNNNIGSVIFFEADETQPYYKFSNFAKSPFRVDGVIYPTAEHFFQSQKFIDYNIRFKIINVKSPKDVFNLANSKYGVFKDLIRKDWWGVISNEVMLKAQLYKYSQNLYFLEYLLLTGDSILIEDGGSEDDVWGNGKKGSTDDTYGQNRLGKILSKIRMVFKNTLETGNLLHIIYIPNITPPIINFEVNLKNFGFSI